MRQTKYLRVKKFVYIGILILTFNMATSRTAAAQATEPAKENIVVRGSLVCVNPGGHEAPCTGKEDAFGLKDAAGRIYALKSDKSLETLRIEPRIQSKDFQLTLRQIKNSSLYEIIKSRFFRDGKLYDFYYFCDVCNIKTYHPGLCMCCRQETEYREVVVN